MTGPAAVLALCRFGQDAAATLLWGASAYLWALVPPGLASAVSIRLRFWAAAMVGAAVLAIAVRLPVQAANVGEGWMDALDPTLLRSLVIDTSIGWTWMAQAVCALLVVAAALWPATRRLGAVTGASGLLLASLGLDGHASSREGWPGLLLRGNELVHVWSGGAWLGSLIPVLTILAMARSGAWRSEAATALRRFSHVGHVAVALVLISGALATALIVGRWPIDLGSSYEMLLDAKILCVLAMAGLAIVNRYLLVPRLAQDPEDTGRALRLATVAEIPLGLAALALVAVFGLMDPS